MRAIFGLFDSCIALWIPKRARCFKLGGSPLLRSGVLIRIEEYNWP